jgi:hypothetical protein
MTRVRSSAVSRSRRKANNPVHVYIANHTLRKWHFHYRLPEHPKLYQLELDPGQQDFVPGPDKDKPRDFDNGSREFESFRKQLEQAGAVAASDPKALTSTYAMLYDSKPIEARQITAARKQDEVIRRERAQDEYQKAGLAQFESLNALGGQHRLGRLGESTLEIVEVKPGERNERVRDGVEIETTVSTKATGARKQTAGGRGRNRQR